MYRDDPAARAALKARVGLHALETALALDPSALAGLEDRIRALLPERMESATPPVPNEPGPVRQGYDAFLRGLPLEGNPYAAYQATAKRWDDGWRLGKRVTKILSGPDPFSEAVEVFHDGHKDHECG